MITKRKFIFKYEGGPESEACVYTFQQYLLVRNGTDVVQGILTTYDREFTQYDYQSLPFHDGLHVDLGPLSLGDLDLDTRVDIVDIMNKEGISILDTEFIHHSTFHIPSWHLYRHHGDLEEAIYNACDSTCHWCLHIFD